MSIFDNCATNNLKDHFSFYNTYERKYVHDRKKILE